MKFSKFSLLIATVAGAALLGNLALWTFAVAYAPTLKSTGQVEILAGGLSLISVPSSANFGAFSVSPVTENTTPAVFSQPVEYVDFRNTRTPYDINVTATALDDIADADFIFYTGLSIRANGATPMFNSLTGNCGLNTDPLTTFTSFAGTGTTSLAVNLVHGNAGVDFIAQCRFKPAIRVTVPAFQGTGTYRSTLTFSIL